MIFFSFCSLSANADLVELESYNYDSDIDEIILKENRVRASSLAQTIVYSNNITEFFDEQGQLNLQSPGRILRSSPAGEYHLIRNFTYISDDEIISRFRLYIIDNQGNEIWGENHEISRYDEELSPDSKDIYITDDGTVVFYYNFKGIVEFYNPITGYQSEIHLFDRDGKAGLVQSSLVVSPRSDYIAILTEGQRSFFGGETRNKRNPGEVKEVPEVSGIPQLFLINMNGELINHLNLPVQLSAAGNLTIDPSGEYILVSGASINRSLMVGSSDRFSGLTLFVNKTGTVIQNIPHFFTSTQFSNNGDYVALMFKDELTVCQVNNGDILLNKNLSEVNRYSEHAKIVSVAITNNGSHCFVGMSDPVMYETPLNSAILLLNRNGDIESTQFIDGSKISDFGIRLSEDEKEIEVVFGNGRTKHSPEKLTTYLINY